MLKIKEILVNGNISFIENSIEHLKYKESLWFKYASALTAILSFIANWFKEDISISNYLIMGLIVAYLVITIWTALYYKINIGKLYNRKLEILHKSNK